MFGKLADFSLTELRVKLYIFTEKDENLQLLSSNCKKVLSKEEYLEVFKFIIKHKEKLITTHKDILEWFTEEINSLSDKLDYFNLTEELDTKIILSGIMTVKSNATRIKNEFITKIK